MFSDPDGDFFFFSTTHHCVLFLRFPSTFVPELHGTPRSSVANRQGSVEAEVLLKVSERSSRSNRRLRRDKLLISG